MNPQFESLAAFFAMGGHGLYVWLAYGATALVLLGSFFMLRSARRRQFDRLPWMNAAQAASETERESTENE